LNTHHHHDHVGGNAELKTEGVKVYGPANDGNIPGMDNPLTNSDILSFGNSKAIVIDVGGHTLGHIAYYFQQEKTAFVGDSLFALGCGRMFEGTAPQFWSSLKRLRDLPDDTTMYCAHEYTESNARYAMSVEPGNELLVKRVEEIKAKRSRGEPTVPSLMGEEKLTNPFLRGDVSDEIKKNVGATSDDDDATIFLKIRQGKDDFRG
jgi:hydroxyacylglutathione hydrolase